MLNQLATNKDTDKGYILAKAFFRAADILQLERKDVRDILGPSLPTLHRMITNKSPIAPNSKEGEIALMLLRIYRSLDSLFGGNESNMQSWFTTYNTYLNGIPKELVRSIGGLYNVAEYLDSMRGKV